MPGTLARLITRNVWEDVILRDRVQPRRTYRDSQRPFGLGPWVSLTGHNQPVTAFFQFVLEESLRLLRRPRGIWSILRRPGGTAHLVAS